MSKGIIIAIIIGIIAVGIAGASFLGNEIESIEPTSESTLESPEPPVPKGRDIQINLEDGLAMSATP